jgi:hypothetical protein
MDSKNKNDIESDNLFDDDIDNNVKKSNSELDDNASNYEESNNSELKNDELVNKDLRNNKESEYNESEDNESEDNESEDNESEDNESEDNESEDNESEDKESENEVSDSDSSTNIDLENSKNSGIKPQKGVKEVAEINIVNEGIDSQSINNNSNLNFFNNDNVSIIKEEVAKEEHELVYEEDEIYLHDLENEFLSEYPISKQSMRYIQEQALTKAQEVLDLKNFGLKVLSDEYRENKIIGDYVNHKFNNKFLIPIVFDRKRYYRQIESNELVTGMNIIKSEIDEKKSEGIMIDDQKLQFKKLKDLDKKNYEYKEYLQKLYDIIRPHVLFEDNRQIENGIKFKCPTDCDLLRYFNIQNIDWENRVGLSGYSYNLNEKSEEKGEYDTERKILTEGEEINVTGFFKLPYQSDKIYSNNIGRFVKNNNIDKIEVGTTTTLTVKNHNLEKGEIIFINNTNSSPSIDGKYVIESVSNNDKIIIDLNTEGGNNGSSGDLYNMHKLSYRINYIKKINKKYEIVVEKKIINEHKNKLIADVYLFNDIIDEKDYIEILNLIIPSYQQIINNKQEELSKCILYQDIDNILLKYNINIGDLDINDFDLIKQILKKNIPTVPNKKIIKNNKDRYNKKFIKLDTNDLYDNKFLNSDLITKYYGTYPLLKSKYDNYTQRSIFIDNSYDGGNLYYSHVLSIKNKEFVSMYNKEKLQKVIRELEKDIQKKKNKLEDEKKIAKYLNKDPCDIYSDDSTNEDRIHLKNGKLMEFKNNNWKESNKDVQYDDIRYICNFDNIDIDKLDLQKLQCYYFSNNCKNKKIYRLEEGIQILEVLKNKIGSIIKFMDSSYLNSYFTQKININQHKLYRFLIPNVQPKIEKLVIEESTKCKITNIIDKILQIKDDQLKRYLIFKIIDKDGILIDNFIYSKTFKCKIICGHWLFLKRIANLSHNNEIENMYTQLYSTYSDGGDHSTNFEICKYCGNILGTRGYDAVDGFNADGKIKNVRQKWDFNEYDVQYLTDSTKINFYKDIQTSDFKELLIAQGVDYANIKIATTIAEMIRNVSLKIGIMIRYDDYLHIILDCISNFIEFPSYDIFRHKETVKLRNKGVPKEKIIQLYEKEHFKTLYKKNIRIKEVSIVASRLLLTIQTAIPDYTKNRTDIKCVFSTFDGEDGFDYMTCVVTEMKMFDGIFSRYELKEKNEQIKKSIIYLYQQYTNKISIREAIQFKKDYLYDKEKIKNDIKNDIKNEKLVITTPIQLSPNFIEDFKKTKDSKQISKLIMDYYIHTTNVSKKIVNIIIEYISKSIKLESTIESSCCISGIKDNYYKNINEKYPTLNKLISESIKLIGYQDEIKIDGSYTRIQVPRTIKYDIVRQFTYINEKLITQNLIYDNFLNFCSIGGSEGEHHDFIDIKDKKKCIKCGLTEDEIKNKDYNIDDFHSLMEKIMKHSLVYKKSYNIKNNTNKPNLKSNGKIDENIDKFMKNIKDYNIDVSLFTKKYFENIGLYDMAYNIDNISSDKESILNKEGLNSNRVYVLKNIINQHFRKYISLIKNNMVKVNRELKIEDDDKKVIEEIQLKILNENTDFIQFTTKNKDLFDMIYIKESLKDINEIKYENNVYDCKYTKIISQSKFNANDASKLLLNILYTNLNKFYEIVHKNIKSSKEDYLRTLTLFILNIFKKIEVNKNIFNISNKKMNEIKGSIGNKLMEEDYKKQSKATNEEKEFVKVTGSDSIENDITKKMENEIKKKDHVDAIMEKAKNELYSKEGKPPTVSQIDSYKDDYLHDEQIDDEIEQDSGLVDSADADMMNDFDLLDENVDNE